jgi:hypothetical protein
VAGFECDALALLVVRLASDRPGDGGLHWHPWDEVAVAEPDGLSAAAASSPGRNAPFKRFPGSASSYFTAPVERVLFPPSGRGAGRWACCPDELYLDVDQIGKPSRTARIELLERLVTPIGLGGSFGLVHLSLCPAEEEGAPDTLSWNSALRTTYLKANNPLGFRLRHGDREVELDKQPARKLVEELFGDPHLDMERHLYAMTMTSYPPEMEDDPELQREWRQALAKRFYRLPLDADGDQDPAKEERQTIRMNDIAGLVLGNCAVFTAPRPVEGLLARNFRSYWTESLMLGLIQQSCLEEFQRRIVAVDDPQGPSIEELHDDWFSFCRLVWRSHPAIVAGPPQELLALIRQARGTGQLFAELEEDFAGYSEHRHRDVEGRQAAIANLQLYGVPAVVLTTLATIIGLLGASGLVLGLLLAASLAAAVGAFLLVKRELGR